MSLKDAGIAEYVEEVDGNDPSAQQLRLALGRLRLVDLHERAEKARLETEEWALRLKRRMEAFMAAMHLRLDFMPV